MNLHERKLRVGVSATTDALLLACADETESLTQSVSKRWGLRGTEWRGEGGERRGPWISTLVQQMTNSSVHWLDYKQKLDNEIQVMIEKENLSANQDSSLATHVRGLLILPKKGVVINIKTAL